MAIARFVSQCSRVFSLLVAAIALTLPRPLLANPSDTSSQGTAAAPIPFSELGAKATAEYHGDALGITATTEGAELRTRFQQLSGLATREGLWLQSTEKEGGRLRLIAHALGRENAAGTPSTLLIPLPSTGTVAVGDKVVVFARPGLTEEYSVSVDGLRQDFVIAERPTGGGDLRVELALTGARAEVAASGVKLTLEGSLRELAYTRLRVVDAAGRDLAASLEVLASNRLGIRVADDAAVYPIRIDPTFSDADWVSLNPSGISGAYGEVYAIVVDPMGTLYIGGSFEFVGTGFASGVAKWDGTRWSALGDGANQGVNGFVFALALSGSDLYVGGGFTSAGGQPANRIAKWDTRTASWSALGEVSNQGVNSSVRSAVLALAVSGSELYVGGGFTSAGGRPANNIAKWDTRTASWSTLGEAANQGVNSSVRALAVSGSDLYAGGLFTSADGISANGIAKWETRTASWSALGEGANQGVSGSVLALAVSGSNLYVGGDFTSAGGISANSIAKWDASTASWSALGEGVDHYGVFALATDSANHLFVGGNFFTAGNKVSPFIAQANLTPAAPEIAVLGNGAEIANGDTTPSRDDHTDFGSHGIAEGPLSRTFTLLNSGTAPLTVTAISPGGPDAALFTVSGLGFPATLAPAETRTFTVTFTPTTPGTFTAMLSIVNDDDDENPYQFTVRATRLNSPAVARDDSFSVLAGTPVVIPISALLANDSDPDGSPLSLVDVGALSSPGHPDDVVTRDGSTLRLTAPSDDVSEASFTYRISDGASESIATVHLHLESVPLVYEGFNYPVGEHLAAPAFTNLEPEKNGGFGWAGPWTTTKSILVFPISDSSLVPPVTGLPVSGGAAVSLGSASRPIRPIGIAPGQKLWFSAVLRGPALVVGDVLLDFDFVDVGMRFGTYSPTGTLPLGWGLTAYSTSTGGTAVAAEPALLVAEVEHTTVSHYDFRFYVNPLPGATPPAPTAAHGLDRFGGFDSVHSVTISDFGATEQAGFDEIRIGRSYASVTSSNARRIAAVNEIRGDSTGTPGSFSLQFGAPEGGTYVLRRKLLCTGGDFEDFISQNVAEAGLITFVDTLDTCGALYQVVRTGP